MARTTTPKTILDRRLFLLIRFIWLIISDCSRFIFIIIALINTASNVCDRLSDLNSSLCSTITVVSDSSCSCTTITLPISNIGSVDSTCDGNNQYLTSFLTGDSICLDGASIIGKNGYIQCPGHYQLGIQSGVSYCTPTSLILAAFNLLMVITFTEGGRALYGAIRGFIRAVNDHLDDEGDHFTTEVMFTSPGMIIYYIIRPGKLNWTSIKQNLDIVSNKSYQHAIAEFILIRFPYAFSSTVIATMSPFFTYNTFLSCISLASLVITMLHSYIKQCLYDCDKEASINSNYSTL